MMKRLSTPQFQNPPPAKHIKLPLLSEDDLTALSRKMRGSFLTSPAGSSFTSDAIDLVPTFWQSLYRCLGEIKHELQQQLEAPVDVDWSRLLDTQDSDLYKIFDCLATEPVLERNWEPLLTFREFFVLAVVSISSVR